jgi:hypothetical protein
MPCRPAGRGGGREDCAENVHHGLGKTAQAMQEQPDWQGCTSDASMEGEMADRESPEGGDRHVRGGRCYLTPTTME